MAITASGRLWNRRQASAARAMLSSMANRHFGKLADVWKHLVLAEVLAVDRPDRFFDTHSGHAVYVMANDAERRYGVLRFMVAAADDAVLAASTYFRILEQRREGRQELTEYPAGPMIAMLELGEACMYCFCDLDPESCANVREAAGRLALDSRVEVVQGDGMTSVQAAVVRLSDVKRTVVFTDPFDHRAVGPAGVSALDLAKEASEVGATVVYWYGYDRADQRAWVFNVLREAAPSIGWWCGDIMIASAHADMFDGDLGAATSPGTGFGLVCANVSPVALGHCDGFGRALSAAYEGHPLPDGRPGRLEFATWTATTAAKPDF